MMNVKVIVNGTERSVPLGTGLSRLLAVDRPCGGHGTCGKCRVIARGALSPVSDGERALLSPEDLEQGVRLACYATVQGECTVEDEKKAALRQIAADGQMPAYQLNPAFRQYGAAIDIGTTTLAARLYDAEGTLMAEAAAMNPQDTFGADVVTRMEAALKGEGEQLATTIIGALDALLKELKQKTAISAIDGLVLTGNTVMLHLLTQTDPAPLSKAPFQADRLFGEEIASEALGLKELAPGTSVYLPPCISAFVGADTVCAMLSSTFCDQNETRLLADIGTNGELALWHRGTLTVCSTAAGPAFEGAGISMGMRGESGAIDQVTCQYGELQAHIIGEGIPKGICGSGLVDAIACLLELEELDETGFLEEDAVIAAPVALTAKDIRMVQLAKSAICAGIIALLTSAELTPGQVDRFYIAGGFGEYLNLISAARIGLFPAELAGKVRVTGNGALSGAALLLLDRSCRTKAMELAKKAGHLELANDPTFAEEYMNGMMF